LIPTVWSVDDESEDFLFLDTGSDWVVMVNLMVSQPSSLRIQLPGGQRPYSLLGPLVDQAVYRAIYDVAIATGTRKGK